MEKIRKRENVGRLAGVSRTCPNGVDKLSDVNCRSLFASMEMNGPAFPTRPSFSSPTGIRTSFSISHLSGHFVFLRVSVPQKIVAL